MSDLVELERHRERKEESRREGRVSIGIAFFLSFIGGNERDTHTEKGRERERVKKWGELKSEAVVFFSFCTFFF